MKNTLLLTSISTVNILTAQIIAKDNAFANSGKLVINNYVSSVNDVYGSRMLQDQDGNIYFTCLSGTTASVFNQTIISKINSAGVVDTGFGTNGKTLINSYLNPNSNLQKQTDGKLLMMGFHPGTGSDTNTYADIIRLLPNGQLDPSFGTSGIASFAKVSSDMDKRFYGLIQQGSKIIFYGEAYDNNTFSNSRVIYRLNGDGSIDSSFGTNGTVTTQGRFLFVDSSSNIVSFTSESPSNGIIEKFTGNGQRLTAFRSNGTVNLTFDPGPITTAFLDSNDNIVYANRDGKVGRISPNGVLDNTFVFDPVSLPFTAWIFSIIEKSGFYFVGGMNTSNNEYFISKLDHNGSINSAFGYFVETDSDLLSVNDLIINNDNIIAAGNGYIVKYHTNNDAALSAIEWDSDITITFENPIRDYLIYTTNQKLNHIDIYSTDGKLVKTLINGNKHISDLPKGTYFVRVTTENGVTITKKLIKS